MAYNIKSEQYLHAFKKTNTFQECTDKQFADMFSSSSSQQQLFLLKSKQLLLQPNNLNLFNQENDHVGCCARTHLSYFK